MGEDQEAVARLRRATEINTNFSIVHFALEPIRPQGRFFVGRRLGEPFRSTKRCRVVTPHRRVGRFEQFG
jgi:hypothetical protein